jgi:hypothetical protein
MDSMQFKKLQYINKISNFSLLNDTELDFIIINVKIEFFKAY